MASSFIHELMAGSFSKLSGLSISGTIPLHQDLVNEALGELVEGWSQPQKGDKSSLPVTQVLAVIKKVQIRAEPGVITIDFEIRV